VTSLRCRRVANSALVRPTWAIVNGSTGSASRPARSTAPSYLTILVLLEEDRTDPEDAAAILVGTAVVFWLAHVYAHLVPRIAAEGRLRTGHFLETAGDQVGILTAVAIPVVPLILAMLGLLDDRAGLRAAIAAGIP
jgi:hypothetical protein